ncbi:MAG TPA: hypothetical protein VGL86_21970 [Polyangia bacterium]|jgi:hypothetical protein
MRNVAAAQDEEITLDPEVDGVTVTLQELATAPPPSATLTPAPGYAADEWAAALADGRVLAFLREPAARCHFDRLLLLDGERRFEQPLPPWIYYGDFLVEGPPGLLLGGRCSAWRLGRDGTLTTLFDEPDGQGVHVAWRGDTAVAAGSAAIVLEGPDGRVTLPCRHAVGACVVAPGIVVVSDDGGSQWIEGSRVVARDWRTYREARGEVIIASAGEAFRVRLSRSEARSG